jgi:two-component system cell cycle sensor histidine kinase/response regulator CckA
VASGPVQLRLYATFIGGWLFASVAIVRGAVVNGDSGTVTAAWFFVAGTGALVAALIDRDVRARHTTQALLAERQALIESLGLVTDPRLTQLPLYQLLDELLRRARTALRGDSTAVFLADDDRAGLELTATSGVPMPDDVLTVDLGVGLIGSVAATRRGVSVPEAPKDAWGTASLMAAPLVAEGQLVGVLQLGFNRRREFRNDDLRLLQVVADRAAVAIEASRHQREARRALLSAQGSRARLALLAEAGRVLTGSFDSVEAMADTLTHSLVPSFFDCIAFFRLDRDQRVVSSVARFADDRAAGVPTDWEPVVRLALQRDEPVLLWGDALKGNDLACVRALELTSVVLAPIVSRGRTVAVMGFGTAGQRRGFRSGDLDTLRDLTARVSATIDRVLLEAETQVAALRALEGEARVLALYDATPVGLVELDADHRPVRWNRAAERLFGWPAFVADAPVTVTVQPAALAVVAGGDRAASGEVSLAEADVELFAVPLRQPSGNRGVVLAAVDVTERRQVAEQLQQAHRMEAMARMAGGIAHDFNNVLMVITGYADLLLRRGLDDDVREDIDAMRAAAVRAAEFTRKLLTISRRQMVQPQVVDVAAEVRSLGDVLAVMLGSGIEIVIDVVDPPAVFLDPAQLEQLLLNLAINARDAMHSGGTLRIAARGDGADWAVIEVADTGEGMDAATLEVCFEPFFTTKDRTKGTGLGLSTVYSVVTQAGGTIEVDSEPGRGTTFTVRLPAASEQAAPRAADWADLGGGALRILVVDDEPDVRSIVGDMLELEGHHVVLASSAEEALDVVARVVPDVLLTDVVMPGMRGPQLARAILDEHPGVRVVLMSSHVDDEAALRSEVPDAVFLAKPFSGDALVATIATVQGSKR